MGSEAEVEPISIPKLPLFSIPPLQSPEPSGMLTPPLQTIASVPFRWEEEPGKPRPCTTLTLTTTTTNKSLELPPRLLLGDSKITNMPSPTTVLEGPYMGRPVFHSSSFRIKRDVHHGSFGCSDYYNPDTGQLGALILSKRGQKDRGLLGSWGRKRAVKVKGKREMGDDGGGSFVFLSGGGRERESGDEEGGYGSESSSGGRVKMTKIRRSGSFLGISHPRSHFWATIYEGLKQVNPWKSRKLKKDGVVI